jgi:hypothetical protein
MLRNVGHILGGVVAAEGSFWSSRLPPRADGSERKRFAFSVTLASRDRALLEALQNFLSAGSIRDAPAGKAHWQPTSTFAIVGHRDHHRATIPFALTFLAPSAKREQFDRWLNDLVAYEAAHPSRWGQGRSQCSVPGCEGLVRGRGLCRSHYYQATGY